MTQHYRVIRKSFYLNDEGQVKLLNQMDIGAVIADSPMEALDIALNIFPLKTRELFHVKQAVGEQQIQAAVAMIKNRQRELAAFDKLMNGELCVPAYSDEECKGA